MNVQNEGNNEHVERTISNSSYPIADEPHDPPGLCSRHESLLLCQRV